MASASDNEQEGANGRADEAAARREARMQLDRIIEADQTGAAGRFKAWNRTLNKSFLDITIETLPRSSRS